MPGHTAPRRQIFAHSRVGRTHLHHRPAFQMMSLLSNLPVHHITPLVSTSNDVTRMIAIFTFTLVGTGSICYHRTSSPPCRPAREEPQSTHNHKDGGIGDLGQRP